VPPQVVVTGVVDGQNYRAAAAPNVAFSGRNIVFTTVTLDGLGFENGSAVSGEGAHALYAQARNAAGLEAGASVSFTIDLTSPTLNITFRPSCT